MLLVYINTFSYNTNGIRLQNVELEIVNVGVTPGDIQVFD